MLVEVRTRNLARSYQVLKFRLTDIQRGHKGMSANLFSNRGMNCGHHRSLLKGDDFEAGIFK